MKQAKKTSSLAIASLRKQTSSNTNTDAETIKQSQYQLCLIECNPADLLHRVTDSLSLVLSGQRRDKENDSKKVNAKAWGCKQHQQYRRLNFWWDLLKI